MSDLEPEAGASAETGDVLAEAVAVLSEAGIPLHYREMTRRIQRRGCWTTGSRTPETVLNIYLNADLRRHGDGSRFARTGRGIFGLRFAVATSAVTPSNDAVFPTTSLEGRICRWRQRRRTSAGPVVRRRGRADPPPVWRGAGDALSRHHPAGP